MWTAWHSFHNSLRGEKKMPFTNKTVLITGAGAGIGRAAAETFAQQGAQVAVADMNQHNADETVNTIRQAGGTAMAFVSDVSQRAAVATMVAAVRQTYGAIHILVNNAGIALPSMSIVEVDAATWQRVLQVNLKSMLFCCQAVVPQMIAAGEGRIVNTASTAARVPRWEIGPYCVSKAAVLHFTRCLAMELAQYQITVNAVGPGATITNLRQNSGVPEAPGTAEARREGQLKGDMEIFRIGVPLGRLGEPQDQAHAIVFLASDEARYISGQRIYVDGLQSQC
jgi:NAD(P)-dependent dehydrogenase (short-subunit alcohol dehydrogenase family)